jgi:hypothetical protein
LEYIKDVNRSKQIEEADKKKKKEKNRQGPPCRNDDRIFW